MLSTVLVATCIVYFYFGPQRLWVPPSPSVEPEDDSATDVAPVVVKLDELILKRQPKNATQDEEPDTCPRRKRTSIGRKSKGD